MLSGSFSAGLRWVSCLAVVGAAFFVGCQSAEDAVSEPQDATQAVSSVETSPPTPAEQGTAETILAAQQEVSDDVQVALQAAPTSSGEPPTFCRDIAPIMYRRCAMCHRPEQSAPFSLLTYADVRSHAQQVADVTASRYMPPWMPDPGEVKFKHERRLTEEELETIQRWVAEGAPEGDPSELPSLPEWPSGWQLGEPDLIITMEEPYLLRADGDDVFRQFVIPVPISSAKYVRAVELHPGNKRVVHHANIIIDRTRSSRRLDAEDEEVGFSGMESRGEAGRPEGQFLTWVPGRVPSEHPPGMAWRLGPGTDLILQFHMFPSGKVEPIQPTIGLYFCPPPEDPAPVFVFLMDNRDINIPAGAKNYQLADDFELPIDVDLLGVYPHAHYVGKEIQGYATLPNGTRKTLLQIKDWDFNWQDVYHYETPLHLPKGTVLSMRYRYDNSAENPRNPSHPPKRVVGGNGSQDEMCHLWPQVLARSHEDLTILKEALSEHFLRKYQHPDDRYNVGRAHLEQEQYAEAAFNFRQLLTQNPKHVRARVGLGVALKGQGKLQAARREFEAALRIEPNHPEAHVNLAIVLRKSGDPDAAVRHLRSALREKQDMLPAFLELAELQRERGKLELAARAYQMVLGMEADHVAALNGLGRIEYLQGDKPKAAKFYQQALAVAPDDAESLYNLGLVLGEQGKLPQAKASLQKAARSRPDSADILYNLAIVHARSGELAEARTCFEKTLVADPDYALAREGLKRLASSPGGQNLNSPRSELGQKEDHKDAIALNAMGKRARSQGKLQEAKQYYEQSLAVEPNNFEATYYLGTILGGQGKLAEAIQQFQKATQLQPNSAPAHLGLASVFARQNKLELAQEHLEEVLRIDPKHAQALRSLKQIQAVSGKPER